MNPVTPITGLEIAASWSDAERKLEKIIKREGDADGARLEESYFYELLKEIIIEKREVEAIKKGMIVNV